MTRLTDHDIAGEVLGIDFDELSRWQVIALAGECMTQVREVSRTDAPYEKRISDHASELELELERLLKRVD